MPVCPPSFFVWFSFSQQILQNVSWRRRIAAFVWHPGAQWGRPPNTADCNLHSRWLQNAFHELSETPSSVLNALLNLWGFRGALCSHCQDFCLASNCMLELVVIGVCGLAASLAFYCWFSVDYRKVGFEWQPQSQITLESFCKHPFSSFEKSSLGLCGKICELVLQQHCQLLFLTLASFLNLGICQRKGKRKTYGDTLVFMLNFMFKRVSWVTIPTYVRLREKKYVKKLIHAYWRQNFHWRGGKRSGGGDFFFFFFK